VLQHHARDVERELRHVLAPPAEREPLDLDEPEEERETERSEVPAFVPVAADVSPQLSLFGAAPGAAVAAPAAPVAFAPAVAPGAPAPAEDPESERPAFERRALLRDKRHRLVADLRRRDGRSHAEINRWLNAATGVRRVDDASIAQLEQSIELLLGALSGRPARR
jgi:hypothetical protein